MPTLSFCACRHQAGERQRNIRRRRRFADAALARSDGDDMADAREVGVTRRRRAGFCRRRWRLRGFRCLRRGHGTLACQHGADAGDTGQVHNRPLRCDAHRLEGRCLARVNGDRKCHLSVADHNFGELARCREPPRADGQLDLGEAGQDHVAGWGHRMLARWHCGVGILDQSSAMRSARRAAALHPRQGTPLTTPLFLRTQLRRRAKLAPRATA